MVNDLPPITLIGKGSCYVTVKTITFINWEG